MVYHAPSGCSNYLAGALERAVNALPPAWLLPPQTGEIFDSIPDAERRLRGYSLAEGFNIAYTGGGTRKVPGARFECCYHGTTIKNWRKLEEHVEKDEKGNIISRRQRERTIVG
jgi:hypothetical protein